jgi:hypothetical protein
MNYFHDFTDVLVPLVGPVPGQQRRPAIVAGQVRYGALRRDGWASTVRGPPTGDDGCRGTMYVVRADGASRRVQHRPRGSVPA